VEGKYWVNNHAHVLKPIGIDEKLLESYLVKLDLNPYITGAAPPKLTLRKLKEIPVPVPSTPEEQQKIASCLSSLDELIAAHNDKLDALKDHKKGLLQNLFPQEGETVPKVRFPEFEDDGDWVEKKLGQIGVPLMCKRIFKDQTTPNSENRIPFYKIGTFGKEPDSYIAPELYKEFKSKYNFPKKGDILISASGTIGRLVVYDGEPAYFQDSNIVWLGHSEKEVSNDFLYYCYSIVNWQTSDGGVIKRLYNSDLKAISIKFPENEKEQKKIASCLSAVDELITAQQQKIEELQLHKKGLMQGLFPKIES
jgi:type I restriction enzyme S subunit